MPDTTAQPCPCGKSKTYGDCCYRFISGKSLPKTPEQLMRSRYSAYAQGGLGGYLLKTWFPFTARGLSADDLSQRKYRWVKLVILNRQQSGDEGTVEFKAYHRPLDDDEAPEEVLHEVSEFRRISGVWLYVGAQVN